MASRSRTWTVQVIIFNFFDLAITNSWIQYKSDSIALDHPAKNTKQYLEFKLLLAQELIAQAQSSSGDGVITDSRDDHYELHCKKWVLTHSIPIQSSAFARDDARQTCIKMPKKSDRKTYVMCTKCKMFLCAAKKRNCFKEYHIQNAQNKPEVKINIKINV
ncbi:UNVERIFIED_CONTAM: hypothetical protein FKN15_011901 [Acipenser sinensis]